MDEVTYMCDDCGDTKCTIKMTGETEVMPTNCIFGGGTCQWINTDVFKIPIDVLVHALEIKGYACIKKTREE
jgi:hypothetical protein